MTKFLNSLVVQTCISLLIVVVSPVCNDKVYALITKHSFVWSRRSNLSQRFGQSNMSLFRHIRKDDQKSRVSIAVRAAEESNVGSEDWRDFRAKLVSSESAADSGPSSSQENNGDSDGKGWAYDAGSLIEKGSLVVSKVESTLGCHDLNQPYFHKAIVMVLDHDEEFTKGILLNRPTNLDLTDEDIIYLDDDGAPLGGEQDSSATTSVSPSSTNSWRMSFGGDIAGLFDEKPVIVCLHNITTDLGRSVSDVVVKDVLVTSHNGAKSLVDAGEAKSEDFFTFYGFCGWDPGQLLKEIHRGSWTMVATDTGPIWEELHSQREQDEPREVGYQMWRTFMKKIGKSSDLKRDDYFSDLMLKEWATEMCLVARDDDEDNIREDQLLDVDEYISNERATGDDSDSSSSMDEMIFRALEAAQGEPIKVGTLVRGSSIQPSPNLLHDQPLHKSSVLVFQNDEEFSVGLILNLPDTETYALKSKEGAFLADMTVRYGGSSSAVEKEEQKQEDQKDASKNQALIWLHCSAALRDLRIGAPLGDNGIWTCTQDQVARALDLGLAFPEEFMVVEGFTIWKQDGGAGGIQGEVLAGNLEVVPSEETNEIWQLLLKQAPLSVDTLDENIAITKKAWAMGAETNGNQDTTEDVGRVVYGSNTKVSELADDALRVWIAIFLLGDGVSSAF